MAIENDSFAEGGVHPTSRRRPKCVCTVHRRLIVETPKTTARPTTPAQPTVTMSVETGGLLRLTQGCSTFPCRAALSNENGQGNATGCDAPKHNKSATSPHADSGGASCVNMCRKHLLGSAHCILTSSSNWHLRTTQCLYECNVLFKLRWSATHPWTMVLVTGDLSCSRHLSQPGPKIGAHRSASAWPSNGLAMSRWASRHPGTLLFNAFM